ncbi:MAG TPA: glycoside hydrolase family 15 protein [Solirubrobacteraceae bacterium]
MPAAICDHALLSDCQSAALVTRDGAIDWWPAPRFDSASAFSALLDDDAGHWTIAPDKPFESSWRYLPGTLVVETTMRTGSGTLRLTDALALRAGARDHEIGHAVPHALARHAEVLDGELTVRMTCAPKLEYGLAVVSFVRERGGVATLGGSERLFLRSDRPIELDAATASACVRLRAGEHAAWTLHRVAGTYATAPKRLEARETVADTVAAWRSWSAQHAGYDGLHRDRVQLASRVLQGLTYQPTGALVAAATTSLPERPGGEDNWDYRFAWLRDATMSVRALSTSACADESRRYFDWIVRAAVTCRAEDQMQIVFGVDGKRDLSEHRLDHLAGHLGSRPVRVGNAAWRQNQLDVLGHVLDAAWAIRDELELDAFTGHFLRQLADRAARQWREPDSGIWEGREGDRHYVVSKVGCWIALDRAVRFGDRLAGGDDRRRWAAQRDELRRVVLRDGFDERRGAFTGALGSDHLDAGVLLLALSGFVEPDDPRMTSTIALLEDELGDDGLLRRWTGAQDGAFLPVSFWLAECHARAGRVERAHEVFERAANAATDLGLLAEEVDLATGDPLGNIPQAISHVGLVNAAQALTHAEAALRGAIA